MIIRSLCNTCLQPYELLIQPNELHLVKQIADDSGHLTQCPRLCGGMINLVGDAVVNAVQEGKKLAPIVNLTGTELYKAVNGAGLPDEVPNSIEVVAALLKSTKVVDVDVEEANGKIYLHEIRLEGGLTIHLGIGGHGPRVVKITKERDHGVPSDS